MGHKSGVPPKANRVYTMFSHETVKTGIEWKSLATSPNVSAKPIGQVANRRGTAGGLGKALSLRDMTEE